MRDGGPTVNKGISTISTIVNKLKHTLVLLSKGGVKGFTFVIIVALSYG
jgi:hypothetical protein